MTRKHLLSKNNIGLCSLIFRAKNISIKHEFELSKSKNQTLDWITNVKLDHSFYAPPMNKYAYLKCYLPEISGQSNRFENGELQSGKVAWKKHQTLASEK